MKDKDQWHHQGHELNNVICLAPMGFKTSFIFNAFWRFRLRRPNVKPSWSTNCPLPSRIKTKPRQHFNANNQKQQEQRQQQIPNITTKDETTTQMQNQHVQKYVNITTWEPINLNIASKHKQEAKQQQQQQQQ